MKITKIVRRDLTGDRLPASTCLLLKASVSEAMRLSACRSVDRTRPMARRRQIPTPPRQPFHEAWKEQPVEITAYLVVESFKTRTPVRFNHAVWPPALVAGMILALVGRFGSTHHSKEATIASATHKDIERRAYQLWQERGSPSGSPDVDWEQAERELSGTRPPDGEAGGMATGVRPHAALTSGAQRVLSQE